MDRQAWIAIILSVIGLVGWEMYVASKYHPLPAGTGRVVINPPAEKAPILTSGKRESVVDLKAPAPAADPGAPEQTETVTTPQLELHYTTYGGGIAQVIPLGKQNVAEDGKNIRLNHAGHIAIGAISSQPGEEAARQPYTMRREGDAVFFERTEPDGLKIVKKYAPDWQGDSKQIPMIKLDVSFTNTGAQPYQSSGYYVYAGSASPIHRRDLAYNTAFDWLADGHYHTTATTAFDAGSIPLVGIQTSQARKVITDPLAKAAWVAVKNQFYATIVTPINAAAPEQEVAARAVWAQRFDLPLPEEDATHNLPPIHAVEAALELPGLSLAAGETRTQTFQIYAGPKFYSRLSRLGHDEEEVMNFGKFKIVSIFLLDSMNVLKGWLGNYALAIIVLTICVKLVLLYPQLKANNSMRRMSALSPKMTELREKYKDDPAKLNTETMKLYKDYGVNPLGGCLPTLIQMPIFFGFLYMLGTAAELRNSGFLWVHDLSQPDTVARFAGYPINVLPLLMIGAQFWQMSLTPKTGDAQQQKMFMFMPLIFGFFCYNFAAALSLYYTMQGLLTIIQLYATRNLPMPALKPPGSAGTPGNLRKKGGAKPLRI